MGELPCIGCIQLGPWDAASLDQMENTAFQEGNSLVEGVARL